MNLTSSHQHRWPSHKFGTCHVRHNQHLMYVNVPKNATAWMKRVFNSSNSADFYNIQNLEEYQIIIILRDPIERWFSGMSEYIKRDSGVNPNSEIFNNKDVLNILTKTGSLDEHTDLQCRFIEDLPKDNIVYFDCDANLHKNIFHWFDKNNFMYNPFKDLHHTTDGVFKSIVNNLKDQILGNQRLKSKLLKYLDQDVKLYKQTQFYRGGEV